MAKPRPRVLWQHPHPKQTAMTTFRKALEQNTGHTFQTFGHMHKWSVAYSSTFWTLSLRHFPIIYEGHCEKAVDENARMDSIPVWFKGIRLNFAENMLFSAQPNNSSEASKHGKADDKVAVTEVREGQSETKNVTWGQLRKRVGKMSNALRLAGVGKGDRIATIASNSVNTLTVFLATTTLGAIFTSTSPDMGIKGLLDRLLQVEPQWVFMDDAAVYNGKHIDLRPKMRQVVNSLHSVAGFQGLISIPRYEEPAEVSGFQHVQRLDSFLARSAKDDLVFERINFGDPFYIVYSSGTTGMPKCMLHSTGGVILASFHEGQLHRNLSAQSVILLMGFRCVLYDGSPFFPAKDSLMRIAADQRATHLGISPRSFDELRKSKIVPREIMDLSALESVISTGMVLAEPLFEWFYDQAFPSNVQLANVSGGTDIAGCFALENPPTPLYVGGYQGPALGIDLRVFDQASDGGPGAVGVLVSEGVPGELVVAKPFPNMPAAFGGRDGSKKYFDAYFAKFDDVWTHGDLITVCPETKRITFLGRADGVLNPSGVRFGSAEIYNVIEANFPEIADSLCVGRRRSQDVDESVMLFLLMRDGHLFTDELVQNIKTVIRKELSPRNVPKFVFPTPEIPMTMNMKKVELSVKKIVSGEQVIPSATFLNPSSLQFYYQYATVEEAPLNSKI